MSVFCRSKCEGETPLDVIMRLKSGNESLRDVPMTYAGRLDPLASGMMLILSGDDIDRKLEIQALEKEYDVSILFGLSTDTGDILGKITGHAPLELSESDLLKTLELFVGTFLQAYPMYSSKAVNGTPLWSHARQGNDVELPVHDVTIHSIELRGFETISTETLRTEIPRRIGLVSGDFRQGEILNNWVEILSSDPFEYQIAHIRVTASSGTYMRVLTEDIGKRLGVPALAYRIHRTRVGDYSLDSVLI
jgi:tRNA pseudouridine55 synthase